MAESDSRGCLVVFLMIVLLLTGLSAGVNYLGIGTKAKDLIKVVYPAYETRAEKTLRLETERKQKKEHIFSLEKWMDGWLRKNLPQAKKSQYQPYFYFDHAKVGEDIWVTGGVTFTIDGVYVPGNYVKNFVFYSPDNGVHWQIKWEKPEKGEWLIVGGPGRIKAIDQQRICVHLRVNRIPPETWMLYTIDGGKNWQIHDKWNTTITKRAK